MHSGDGVSMKTRSEKPVTILAVDDDANVLLMVRYNLERAGFRVLTLQDSTGVADLLKAEPVDLILSDIMMPALDGYALYEQVKRAPATAAIPFVFLTAKSQTMEEVRGLEIGVDEYIKKPFDPLVLVARVQAVVERARAATERERLIGQLQEALEKVKQLSGLLPICANCMKIRDDRGYWTRIEAYIRDHSEAEFSHSLCPECARTLYPEIPLDEENDTP